MTPREAYYKCFKKKKRIRELESIIATDPHYSYRYARDIIKGPFIEAEKIIATNPMSSLIYSIDVLKSPFQLGHPIIFKYNWKYDYINFLKEINYDLREIGEWLI